MGRGIRDKETGVFFFRWYLFPPCKRRGSRALFGSQWFPPPGPFLPDPGGSSPVWTEIHGLSGGPWPGGIIRNNVASPPAPSGQCWLGKRVSGQSTASATLTFRGRGGTRRSGAGGNESFPDYSSRPWTPHCCQSLVLARRLLRSRAFRSVRRGLGLLWAPHAAAEALCAVAAQHRRRR